jgi:urate oxidase
MVKKTWQGRQQTVVFVSNSGGVWSYTAQSVIFRKLDVIDPEQPDTSGGAPKIRADAVMIVDIAIDMTGVVYVAYTSTATALAVSTADKYEIIEATQKGIIPAKTHWEVDLRRFRG